MTQGPVRYETTGSTARITLDEPSNRNAITPELLAGVSSGVHAADADDGVRAIVLTHTGTTFCAGADLRSAASGGDGSKASASGGGESDDERAERQRNLGREMNALLRLLLTSRTPVIAAVDGHVRAGGMGIIAACDFAVAGPRATFGLSEVRIGVVPAIIAPLVFARLDDRTASDWVLRARGVSPAEADRAGFVTAAVDDLTATVDDLLTDLRRAAPAALATGKRLANTRVLATVEGSAEAMVDLSAAFFVGADARAGMAAFAAREDPPWVLAE